MPEMSLPYSLSAYNALLVLGDIIASLQNQDRLFVNHAIYHKQPNYHPRVLVRRLEPAGEIIKNPVPRTKSVYLLIKSIKINLATKHCKAPNKSGR